MHKKPVLIGCLPNSFPNGAFAYNAYVADLLGVELSIPDWEGRNPFFVYEPKKHKLFHEGIDVSANGQFTILGGIIEDSHQEYFDELVEYLPKPFFLFIHETKDLNGNPKFWEKFEPYILGYITNNDSEGTILKKSNILYTPLAYIPKRADVQWNLKENCAVSIGRIVPERGHAFAADLTEYGIAVKIIGQRIKNSKYGNFAQNLEDKGCKIYGDLSSVDLRAEVRKAKVFVDFTSLAEKECCVRYAALEAIDDGCIPIVGHWMEKYYEEYGFIYYSDMHPSGKLEKIKSIFKQNTYELIAQANQRILQSKTTEWMEKFDSFVSDLLR